jgi:hypothetical protein
MKAIGRGGGGWDKEEGGKGKGREGGKHTPPVGSNIPAPV